MKIKNKLVIAIALSILAVLITGDILYTNMKRAMEEVIKEQAYSLASEKMDNVDRYIYDEIEILKLYADQTFLVGFLTNSNSEFEQIGDMGEVSHYIQELDNAWVSVPKDVTTPFMESIINNSLSLETKKRIEFLEKERKFETIVEVIITNKYGANAAQTEKTSDYMQGDEGWWQKAKEDGISIGDVKFDESAGVYSIDISVKVEDSNGDFVGVIKEVLNFNEVITIIKTMRPPSEEIENNINFKLINGMGQFIYSTERFMIFENVSQLFLENEQDFFIVKSDESGHNKRNLVIRVPSKGYLSYKGLGWSLLMELDSDKLFNPVKKLRNEVILLSFLACLFIVFIVANFSNRITNNILKLTYASSEIGRGNLDIKPEITTKDELEELSLEIQNMVLQLKNSKKTIEEHSIKLEKDVLEKTKELQQKIEEAETMKKATLNIMEDVEESNRQLVQTQEKLHQNLGELKKLDYQKDQFISIAAHELKTPLTSIKGFSELLGKDAVSSNPELRKKYLEIIYKDAQRLGNLITNILELSRMDLGTMKLSMEDIQVEELITMVKDQMDIIIKSKRLESEYKIEDNLPIINIDRDKVIQVVSNLINNAVHYTEKGKIIIEAKKSGNEVLFGISDTGTGIPKEHWPKIFTRFYQVDNPLTRKIGGTGLGLSISKGFVEAMGGRIWFDSEEGKGTTFYFTIPLFKKGIQEEVSLIK